MKSGHYTHSADRPYFGRITSKQEIIGHFLFAASFKPTNHQELSDELERLAFLGVRLT